jgi:hypothetical protein
MHNSVETSTSGHACQFHKNPEGGDFIEAHSCFGHGFGRRCIRRLLRQALRMPSSMRTYADGSSATAYASVGEIRTEKHVACRRTQLRRQALFIFRC